MQREGLQSVAVGETRLAYFRAGRGQIVNTKSEVSRVEGSAHFPYFEKPEEFDRIVVGFIGRNA